MILPKVTNKSVVNKTTDNNTLSLNTEVKPGITSQFNFLKADPTSYFYQKYKSAGSRYVNDEMWTEAARRGQSDILAYYIDQNEKYDAELQNSQKTDERRNKLLTDLDEYEADMDYDNYMAVLANVTLDDTVKKDRTTEDGTYSFGQFTDKEWNEQIIDSQYRRLDAIRIDEQRENRKWWEIAVTALPTIALEVAGNTAKGVMNAVGDLYNIGEGLLNMCFNWSGDEDVGARFLYATQNDDILSEAIKTLDECLIEYEKYYSLTGLVSAVKAYDEPESRGLTGWGQRFTGLFESIGYMLPSILLTIGTAGTSTGETAASKAGTTAAMRAYKATGMAAMAGKTAGKAAINAALRNASKAVFYAQVFSGNIKETVNSHKSNVLNQTGSEDAANAAYKSLDAGTVIGNAALKAVAQWAVEEALAWVLDASITDRLVYGKGAATQKIIKQSAADVTATGAKAAGIAISRHLKGSLKEGLEETLQDMSDGMIDWVFSKINGGTNLSEIFSDSAAEKFNIKNLVQSFAMGAAMDITIGSFKSLKYVFPGNRQAYENSKGELVKMGAFQTMNFASALETMHQWEQIVSDSSANRQDRIDAAARLGATIDVLTPMFRSMSSSDLVIANQLLTKYAEYEKSKSAIDELYALDNFAFGKALLNTVEIAAAETNDKWSAQKDFEKLAKTEAKKEKIAKALGNKKDYLQEKGVTKVTNVVTNEMSESEIEEAGLPKGTKEFMKKSGANTIVTVDGTGASAKDGDTLIIDDKLAKTGDVPTILKTSAHDTVVEALTKALSKEQKQFIVEVYRKVNSLKGSQGTYKEAVKALLFDSKFYLEVLTATKSNSELQKVITQINQLYEQVLNSEVAKGSGLQEQAVTALLNTVKNNMKQALIVYASHYVLLDIDSISNDILSQEEKEALKENTSVKMTIEYKTLEKEATKGPVEIYDKKAFKYIRKALEIIESKYGVLAKNGYTVETLIKSLQSPSRNTRTDALAVIQYMLIESNVQGPNKLAYSPAEILNKQEKAIINSVYERFGIKDISELSGDTIDWNNVTDDVKSIIVSNKYDVNNKNDRNKIADKLIYELSKGTLALSPEFTIVRVLDSNTYLADDLKLDNVIDINKAIATKLRKGSGTIRDLLNSDSYYTEAEWNEKERTSKVSKTDKKPVLSDIFLNTKIEITKIGKGIAGEYDVYSDSILINSTYKNEVSYAETIFHEVTHITQTLNNITSRRTTIVNGSTQVYTAGGTPDIFRRMSYKEAKKLTNYLAKNFPMIYQLLQNTYSYTDFAQVIYHLLEGELQANLYLGEVLDTLGFRLLYKDGKSYLVSPDDVLYDTTSVQSGLSYAVPIPNKNEYMYQIMVGGKWVPLAKGKGQPIVTTPDRIMSYGLKNQVTIGQVPKFDKMTTEVKNEIKKALTQYKITISNLGNFSTIENIMQHVIMFNNIVQNLPDGIAKTYMNKFITNGDKFMNWLNKAYTHMVDESRNSILDKKYIYNTVITSNPPISTKAANREISSVFEDYANKKISFDKFTEEVYTLSQSLSPNDLVNTVIALALENNLTLEDVDNMVARLEQLAQSNPKSILPMYEYGSEFGAIGVTNKLGKNVVVDSENIKFVENASDILKNDDGTPKIIFRGISHNVTDEAYKRGIFFTNNIGMAGSYTETASKYKAGEIKGFICNIEDKDLVKVNYQFDNWSILWHKIPISAIDKTNLPNFDKNWRRYTLEYKFYDSDYDKKSDIYRYASNPDYYVRTDDIRLFLLKYYPNIKGLAINNIYDFSNGPLEDWTYETSQVFAIFDKSNLKEVSVNDKLYDTVRLLAQAIFTNALTDDLAYSGVMQVIKTAPNLEELKHKLSVDRTIGEYRLFLENILYLTNDHIGSLDDLVTLIDVIYSVLSNESILNLENLTNEVWNYLIKYHILENLHSNILNNGGDYTSETIYDEKGSWGKYNFDEYGRLVGGYEDQFSTENMTIIEYEEIREKFKAAISEIDGEITSKKYKTFYNNIRKFLPASYNLAAAYILNITHKLKRELEVLNSNHKYMTSDGLVQHLIEIVKQLKSFASLFSKEEYELIRKYIEELNDASGSIEYLYFNDSLMKITNDFAERYNLLETDNFKLDTDEDAISNPDEFADFLFSPIHTNDDLKWLVKSLQIPAVNQGFNEIKNYLSNFNGDDYIKQHPVDTKKIIEEYIEEIKKEIDKPKGYIKEAVTAEELETLKQNTKNINNAIDNFIHSQFDSLTLIKIINNNREYMNDAKLQITIIQKLKNLKRKLGWDNDIYKKYSDIILTLLDRLEVTSSQHSEIGDKKWTISDKDYKPYKISTKNKERADRQIKVSEAKGNNLHYWTDRGIYQINPGVKRFVVGTSADFDKKDKLPKFLKDKIKNATLTLNDISYYLKTASNMNEYTFHAIAELVYRNTDLTQLSLKEFNILKDRLDARYAILSLLIKELEKADKLYYLDNFMDGIDIGDKLTIDSSDKLTIEQMDLVWKRLKLSAETNYEDLAVFMNKAGILNDNVATVTKNGKKIVNEGAAIDPNTLTLLFFMNYDGTLDSLSHIATLAKLIAVNKVPLSSGHSIENLSEEGNSQYTSEGEGHRSTGGDKKVKGWNWSWWSEGLAGNVEYDYDNEAADKATEAEIIKSSEEVVQDMLDSIDEDKKIDTIIQFFTDKVIAKISNMSQEEKIAQAASLMNEIDDKREAVYNLTPDQLDKEYISVLREMNQLPGDTEETSSVVKETDKSTDIEYNADNDIKRTKTRLRNSLLTIEKRIITVSRFNTLPDNVKQYFDPVYTKSDKIKGYKQNVFTPDMSKDGKKVLKWNLTEKYANMTNEDLKKIAKEIHQGTRQLGYVANETNIEKLAKRKAKEMLKEREKTMKEKTDEKIKRIKEKTTMREKIAPIYKTSIVNQEFFVTSNTKATALSENLLGTNWSDKKRMSTVQGVTGNVEKDVASAETFFSENSAALLEAQMIDGEIENTCRWFLDTRVNNASDADMQKFLAIKMYFLGWVLEQAQKDNSFANLPANLVQQIEHTLKNLATAHGTGLAVWNNIRKSLDPAKAMASAAMIIDGVEIPEPLRIELFEAAESNNIDRMSRIQQQIMDYASKHTTVKKSIFRKVISVRSAAMLSSPLTWLRNKVSNIALKRLNKMSDAIGAKIMPKRTVEGQLKMDNKLTVTFGKDGKVTIGSKSVRPEVTREIQEFINNNFIDNGLFDKFCKNLSRYNPSEIPDIAKPYAIDKVTGKIKKEYIMSQLVVKAMYNEYYNKNIFKSKNMQKVYSFLMKAMSDDVYVRETCIRYFGQILAEKNVDLSKGMTDEIMSDFAKSMGLALRDYMHSNNLFNKFEKMLMDKNEGYWVAYKLLLPYAGSAWNWFKGMLNYTPIGLIDGIRKFWKLENAVARNEAKWQKGLSDIPAELSEFFIRRQIGAGTLGTIGMCIGFLLAGLGFVKLEDEDYGTPKLKIGNITVDISSIFGTSSILTGAAFVNGLQKKDMWKAICQAFDYTFDSFPLMDILQSDMYTDSILNILANRSESMALSFIPNFISYLAGATYSGTLDKQNNFWYKLAAKLPFMGNFVPKKVNPYTGEVGGVIDLINRIVPYFSYDAASTNESKSEELGLNKTQLKGTYDVNGTSIKITGKALQTLNETYGKLNAKDLGKFYTNGLKVRVKTSDGYKELTYNQMNDYQRKTAVKSIMSNNATICKIVAWTSKGHKYYASADLYNKLRTNGITKNIYRGTKGFAD